MKSLYIERTTNRASVAMVEDGRVIAEADISSGPGGNGVWARQLRNFIAQAAIDEIVVGTGPGSFAGIRAALAFAQGYAIGSGCRVRGLPSACAFAPECGPCAVVGDARRGKYWIALFEGVRLVVPVFQVETDILAKRIPQGVKVYSPDAARIEALLKETFGDNYGGGVVPCASSLARTALANPGLLVDEPLPVYLNPAVRD